VKVRDPFRDLRGLTVQRFHAQLLAVDASWPGATEGEAHGGALGLARPSDPAPKAWRGQVALSELRDQLKRKAQQMSVFFCWGGVVLNATVVVGGAQLW
jgi:hypothetical protein